MTDPSKQPHSDKPEEDDPKSASTPQEPEQDPKDKKQPHDKTLQNPEQSEGKPIAQSSTPNTSADPNDKMTDAVANERPALAETSKKKSRLQWDEDNLISNAQEMERAGPRMKIDEPKTPYCQGSETGSSTSGSAHQSPPESPSFIPGERLVGFRSLEASMRRSSGGASSDGASSAGSAGRSVQISDDFAHSSGGSSPRSKEIFAARRKAHYRNEAVRLGKHPLAVDVDDDDSDVGVGEGINGHRDTEPIANGQSVGVGSGGVRERLAMLNNPEDAEEPRDDTDNND